MWSSKKTVSRANACPALRPREEKCLEESWVKVREDESRQSESSYYEKTLRYYLILSFIYFLN